MKRKYPVLVVRGGIFDDTLEVIRTELADKDGDLIYLLLESPGGDPSIGYRIMRMLQAKYKRIIAVVPGEAYSTATLMALGSDVIYMHESACLGPLDSQIKHPYDGSMISSLDIKEVLNTLAGQLITYGEDFYNSLKSTHFLGKKDAADLAMKTANDLIRPIAEKIDPIYLQASIRGLRLGQKYAEALLSTRMMARNPQLARAVATYLANSYDYHGYAITIDEATGLLALTVKKLVELDVWDPHVKTVFNNSRDQVGVFYDEIEVEIADKPVTAAAANVAVLPAVDIVSSDTENKKTGNTSGNDKASAKIKKNGGIK